MNLFAFIPLLITLLAFAVGIACTVIFMMFLLKGIKALDMYIKKTGLDIERLQNKIDKNV